MTSPFLRGLQESKPPGPKPRTQTISWHIHLPPKKHLVELSAFEKENKQFCFGGSVKGGVVESPFQLVAKCVFLPPFPGVAWIFFPSKSVLWKWDFLYFLMQLISSQNGLGDTNNTVVGRNPAEYGKYPHYLPRFYTSQVVVWDFWTINSFFPKKPHFRNQQIQSSHLSDSANFGQSRWWIE